ncbi:hypothetical protein [Stenotrophomonas sp. B1-1]|uniref:hypothetical protein n=1 Tax=Stenotrophomonas sp. B1-1 TaxID=2710648 RepID=UPI0013D990DB|nr:hypothetical protein [Stenotrophomonas sp. B1-1]
MATRFSRRRADGTVVYYDSEAAMQADAEPMPGLFDFSWLWAVVGFFVSVIVVCVSVYGFDLAQSWPKWLRFLGMLSAVAAGTYLLSRVGQLLFYSFWVLVAVGIVLAVVGAAVAFIWSVA